MPVNVPGLVTDPDFLKLSQTDQQATLAQVDPQFGQLSSQDFSATVQELQKRSLSRPDLVAPPPPAGSGVAATMNGTTGVSGPTNYQPVPQEATPEGHKAAVLARESQENPVLLGMVKGEGTIAKPADDLAKVIAGDTDPYDYTTANGTGQTIGKGIALAGNILPAAITAPAATVGGLAGGAAAGTVGKIVGQHLGLNDDQSNLLADLLAIAGGTAGAVGGAKLQPKSVPEMLTALRGGEDNPGLLKQIFNGADVAQEPAQDAVRTAVGESAQSANTATPELLDNINSEPLLKGNQTILDDHLKGLQDAEKSAYKQVDDTVGFDLKAERKQLSNDQYKLAQLGNTDADVTARGKLLDAINDSQDRINQAQKALTDAGIDPKAADVLHTQRMAGVQFKQSLIKNMNQDGSVKIDGLLKDANNLRNYKMPRSTKFVDRLEQFFGSKQAADSYVEQLQKAQQLGVHAVKAQNVVSYAGKLVAKGVGLGAGIDIAKHFIE